jgi:hypothetical protein
MQKKHDPVFYRVIAKAQRIGIYGLLGMYQEWNTKLVAQFCATAWRSGNGYELMDMSNGYHHRLHHQGGD